LKDQDFFVLLTIVKTALTCVISFLTSLSVFAAAPGQKLWEYSLGGWLTGTGAPTLATNGDLLVPCYDGKLYAITPAGTNRWIFSTPQGVPGSPLVDTDGTIYFGSDKLYALNADGTKRWDLDLPAPPPNNLGNIGSPLLGPDGTIYMACGYGPLCAVRPDRSVRWVLNDGPVAAVMSDGTLLRSLGLMNPDGIDLWVVPPGLALNSLPAVSSSGLSVACFAIGAVMAFGPDGSQLWRYDGDGQSIGGPVIGPDGAIYTGFDSGTVVCLESNGQPRWRYAMDGLAGSQRIYATPALAADGTLYINGDNWLHALGPDGQLRWRFDAGTNILLSPVIGQDGTVYFGAGGSRPGRIFAVQGTGSGLASGEWPMLCRDARHTASYATSTSAPAAPTNVTATLGNYTEKVVVNWSTTARATEYDVLRGITPLAAEASLLASNVSGRVSFEDRSAVPGTTNYYFIIARNSSGSSAPAGPAVGTRRVAVVGEPVWIFPAGSSISGMPAMGYNGELYFASADGLLHALDSSGAQLWTFKTAGNCSSPSIGVDGTIYFAANTTNALAQHAVFALRPNGSLGWVHGLGAISSSDLAIGVDGSLYISGGDTYDRTAQELTAIHPDGTDGWTFRNGRFLSGPSLSADGTIYVGSREGVMHALRPDGTLLWESNVGDVFLGGPILDANGLLYFGGVSIHCLNPDGQERWNFAENGAAPGCMDSAGTIYSGSGAARLYAHDQNGNKLWEFATGGVMSSPVRDANGNLYVTAVNGIYAEALTGKFFAVSPAGLKLWEFSVEQVEFGTPVLATNGLAYLGGTDGQIYAVRTEAGLGSSPWPEAAHDPQHTARARQIVPIPGAPDPLSATYLTRITDVRLTWPSVLGAVSYQLFRATTSNLADATPLTEVTGQLAHDDKSAVPGIAYTYWVSAKNGSGTGPFSSPATGIRRQGVPGEMLYEYPVGGPVVGTPAIGTDGTIYAAVGLLWTNGRAYGNLLAAMLPDGTFKWQYNLPGAAQSAPTLAADGTIYVGVPTGVWAFNPDGSKKWDFTMGNAVASTPALGEDGMLYFGANDAKFYAIEPTGHPLWTNSIGSALLSSPALGRDSAIYCLAQNGRLYALGRDGHLRWQTYAGLASSSCALAPDGTVYVSGGSSGLNAFNPDGSLRFRSTAASFNTTPVTDASGRVYVGSSSGRLYAFDATSSNAWSYLVGGYLAAPAAVSDAGFVYMASATGRVAAVTLDGNLAWEFTLSGGSHSGPAIAPDGTIYLGTDDGKVVSFVGAGGLANSSWPMFQRDLSHTGRETNAPGACSPPPYFTASDGAFIDRVRVAWSNAPNAWFYEVWRSPTANAADGVMLAEAVTVTNSFNDFSASEGVTNFYFVRSGNSLGLSGFAAPDSGYRRVALPGEVLAEYRYGTGISSPASLSTNGSIYVCVDTSARMCALGPDLSLKWFYPPAGRFVTFSMPVLGPDGTVYLLGENQGLVALNSDGSVKWITNLYAGSAALPLPVGIGVDGTLYATTKNAPRLFAVTPGGLKLWDMALPTLPTTAMAIGSDSTAYFGGADNRFYAVNAGGVLWRVQAGGALGSAPAIGPDGTIYFGCDDRRLYAISTEGVLRWRHSADASVLRAPPVVAPDGTILFGGTDGKFYAITQDGTRKWSFRADGAVYGGAAVAGDGTSLFGTAAGSIYALNPDGTVLWQSTNHGNINNSAVLLQDGRLLIGAANSTTASLMAVRTLNPGTDLHWPMAHHDAQHTGRAPGSWVNLAGTATSQMVYAGESATATGQLSLPGHNVVRAELYVGTNLVNVAANPPFSLTWSNASAGTNLLFVRLVDDTGCAYRSAPVTVIASPLLLAFNIDSSGQLSLSTGTLPGRQYSMESSTNLIDWQTVPSEGTNITNQIEWSLQTDRLNPGLKAYRIRATR
jgi:outer membrane protein assembly factor BamB